MINKPPQNDSGGNPLTPGWATFFSNAWQILTALTQSGPTTERPIKILWVGRVYFDTTLGKPVWYKNPGWVDATGAPA